MAPQEVAGLQALAKAHGGSLTVNPDTGLAEAGFLSSILPLVAGAFLGPAGLGLSAMQAGLAAGALGTVATGSLSKGLMAGFGAYGGAGLAGSLMGAGAGAAQNAAMAAVPQGAGAGLTSGMELAALENPAVAGFQAANTGAASSALGATAANPTGIPGFSGTGIGLTPPPSAVSAQQAVLQATPQTFTPAPELTHQGMLNEAAARATPGTELYKAAGTSPFDTAKAGFGEVMKRPGDFMTKENLKYGLAGFAPVLAEAMRPEALPEREKLKPRNYEFIYNQRANPDAGYTGAYTGQRTYFDPMFTEITAAGGGLMDIGPIEAMSDRNQAETMMANGGMRFAEGGKAVSKVEDDPYYTMSGQSGDAFKYLMGQMPAPSRAPAPVAAAPAVVPAAAPAAAATQSSAANTTMRPYTFDPITGTFTAMPIIAPAVTDPTPSTAVDYGSFGMAQGGIASLAQGGPSHLGDYSDGGRLLKGPGDGVSDSIPASIGDKRPARLADGEFVVPARIVSEIGNGSTEAGARKLYAMMDRVQNARKKSIGKNRVAVNSRAEKLLPA
jgi:hypothetical protein